MKYIDGLKLGLDKRKGSTIDPRTEPPTLGRTAKGDIPLKPSAEQRNAFRNKFTQMKDDLTGNHAISRNNAFFEQQNQRIGQKLNWQANKDNEEYIKKRKAEKKELKDYWLSFWTFLERYGYDRNSGQTAEQFIDEYNKKYHFFPMPVKGKKNQWKWVETAHKWELSVKDLGFAGKIFKYIGIDGFANGLMKVMTSVGNIASDPKNASNWGDLGKGILDTGVETAKAVAEGNVTPAGWLKTGVKNVATELAMKGLAKVLEPDALGADALPDALEEQDASGGANILHNTNSYDDVEYALSDADIRKVLPNAKIMKYNQLSDINTIQQLLPARLGPQPNQFDYVFILVELVENVGHWICLVRIGDSILFFDSFGARPDKQLLYAKKQVRRELGQKYPLMSHLLNRALDDGFHIEFNSFQYQSKAGHVQTCGRWVIVFINYMMRAGKDRSFDGFHKYIMNTAKNYMIKDLDYLVTKLCC